MAAVFIDLFYCFVPLSSCAWNKTCCIEARSFRSSYTETTPVTILKIVTVVTVDTTATIVTIVTVVAIATIVTIFTALTLVVMVTMVSAVILVQQYNKHGAELPAASFTGNYLVLADVTLCWYSQPCDNTIVHIWDSPYPFPAVTRYKQEKLAHGNQLMVPEVSTAGECDVVRIRKRFSKDFSAVLKKLFILPGCASGHWYIDNCWLSICMV